MNNPVISAIMTVYNGQLFLSQAIESLLNQSYNNFELIIINDNSSDDTRGIIERFCDQDNRVVIINNPENYGPFISANFGLKAANGIYVARMDSDDISQPSRFEKQLDFLERHKEVGLLGSNATYIDGTGKMLGPFLHFENDLEIRWGSLFNSQFIHSSIMYKRSLLPLTGMYREDYKYAQDYEFTCRLMQYTQGANLKEKLVLWRKTGGSISSQKKETQLKFGTQIAMDNINQLFGYEFVSDHDELLVLRGLYRGSYRAVKNKHVSRFLQILEKFIEVQKIPPAVERRLISGVATRMFESIFRKGLKKENLGYLKIIAGMAPFAILNGIKNLGIRALKNTILWFKDSDIY